MVNDVSMENKVRSLLYLNNETQAVLLTNVRDVGDWRLSSFQNLMIFSLVSKKWKVLILR
jgi:hypothetical protein